jgi:TolB-like protein
MRSWIAVALALAGPVAAGAAEGGRLKLAIMELKVGQGLDARAGATLTAILTADAARAGFEVISQADIASMLAFQKQRQMLGCSDDGCLAEIGGALGADYLVSGEAARVGTRDHLALTLLDARRAKVVGRASGFSEAGDDTLAVAVQQRLRALLRQERPDLVARMPPIEPPGVARLRWRRTVSWWTMGAGAALLAGGGAVGLVARSQAADLKTSWQQPGYQGRYDTQRRTALTADLLLGAGAVAGGVGLVLFLTSSTHVEAVPVAAGGLPGVTLAGRF